MEVTISRLLMKHKLLTGIASTNKFMEGNQNFCSLNASCSLLPLCQRYYIICSALIKLNKKKTIAKKGLLNVLMVLAKTTLLPKELTTNIFPNEMYIHII